MPSARAPVLWIGQTAIVSLPAEIDCGNAAWISDELIAVAARGPANLVVDMTATSFCASAGVTVLLKVQERMTADGARMQLAVAGDAVRRILTLTGVDQPIVTYPSVAACLADFQGQPRPAMDGDGAPDAVRSTRVARDTRLPGPRDQPGAARAHVHGRRAQPVLDDAGGA